METQASNFQLTHNPVRKVAVINDDEDEAAITEMELVDAGFDPLVLTEGSPFESAEQLAATIVSLADAAVCDHRLTTGHFAYFNGAELVAQLYERHLPALLVSQFVNMDEDISIREYRRRLPVVLDREEADLQNAQEQFDLCTSEFAEQFPPWRKPHRTPIVIRDVGNEDGADAYDVLIPVWKEKSAVRLPADLIPESLRQGLKKDDWLFADVNIAAKNQDSLYFDNFQPAPDVNPDDQLA